MPTCNWYERRKGTIVLCVLFLNHLSRLEGFPALSPARASRGDLVQVRETIAAETYCKTVRALLRRRAGRRNPRLLLQARTMHPLLLYPPLCFKPERPAPQQRPRARNWTKRRPMWHQSTRRTVSPKSTRRTVSPCRSQIHYTLLFPSGAQCLTSTEGTGKGGIARHKAGASGQLAGSTEIGRRSRGGHVTP